MIFIPLLILHCTSQGKEEGKNISSEQPKTEIISVKTTPALSKNFEYLIQANGKIEARFQSELKFKTAGQLQKIYVQNGQSVFAGQLLAQLEQIEKELAVQKARNHLAVKKEAYIQEFASFGGDIKKPEAFNPELHERIKVRSGLREAELLLKEAELNLSYCTLQSPMAGTVADLKLKANNYISSNEVFCTVYSANQIELAVDILESEASLLQKGQKAEIKLLSDKQKNHTAYLSEVNPKVDKNGMLRVKLTFTESKGLILGMNATAQIIVPQKQTLVVSKSAIVIRSGRKVVFTEEKGLAKWNYVNTGLENNNEVEIIEGLKAGQKVIISNNLQLAHDSPLRVQK